LQDQFRNSGASVRLASTPLQSYLRTTPNDESESKNSLQAAREPVSSTGQGTPDLIMPDADGFFRPSNTSTSSPTTHSPSSERAAVHNETHAMAQSRGNGAIANWQKSYDGNNVDFAKARPESRSQVSEAAEDYEPTSDFLDDWLNGEGEEDEEDDDESLAPTVSSKSKERKRSTKRVPAPLKSSEASSHQSPSPALLLGLPTPLRAQFQASLAKSANTSSPTSSGPPSALVPHVAISSIVHRAGPTSQQDESLLRAQRDWRARSLPPPPQEEVALETEMTADTGPTTDNNHPIVRKEKPEMLGNSQDTTHDDEKNIVTRASSRASRASSRTGRRSLGRRSSDARRFPVSMHYASGFDTDTLTTNPEAMNSFAELMRSRQSMDLDDVMPLSMTEADGTVPPVPTLPHAAGGVHEFAVSRELPEEVNRYSVEALPSQLRALQPLLRTEEPKKIFGDLILIGEGESGNVYSTIPTSQCVVPSLKGRGKVAIKVINLGTGPEEGEEQKKARQIRLALLHQEMTLWRDGGKQSNILGLYDIFLSTGRPNQPDSVYVVQEFMSISLADIIALRDAGLVIEETHIARITKDLCLALKHLHACTIIHRDVRSDNVLLNFDGKAKLSDFTHATSVAASKRTSTVGTAYWMAPEVINAVPYDTQADMWSLGAVLFEMAVGEPPRVELPALRAIALTTSLGMPPLSEPQRWSNAFRNCLSWCTQMSADERATAEQLLQDPFVASAHSYDALADLVEQARFIEVDALYDHDDEEFVVEERSPSMLQAAPPNTHMRDSWTSQSTVHA
jgi:serine/threonine protein kinase